MKDSEQPRNYRRLISEEQAGESVAVLAFVTGLGALLGTIFLVLALNKPWWWSLGCGLLAAVVAGVSLRKNRTPTVGKPALRSAGECMLASLDAALAYSSVMLSVCLAATGVWGVALALNAVLRVFGFQVQLPASEMGWGIGYFFGTIGALTAGSASLTEVRRNLYGGTYSVYRERIVRWSEHAFKYGSIGILVALALVFGARLAFGGFTSGFWWTLQILLLISIAMLVGESAERRPRAEIKTLRMISRLFGSLDCGVLQQPRLHDNEADKCLGGLDLVAGNSVRGWGVSIKSGETLPAGLEWSAGGGIISAVQAYTDWRPELQGLEAMLVVVSEKMAPIPESLEKFARTNDLKLVWLAMPEVDEVLALTDSKKKRAAARRLLLGQDDEVTESIEDMKGESHGRS